MNRKVVKHQMTNDRLIRLATKWYTDRLSGTSVRVLLITNDRDNERKARSESLNVSSLETYVGVHISLKQHWITHLLF